MILLLTECHWYPWGAWEECKGICGVGVQNRIRQCQGCIPGTGECQGPFNQKRYHKNYYLKKYGRTFTSANLTEM